MDSPKAPQFDSVVIMVEPRSSGRSFRLILAKLHDPQEQQTSFELDILANHDAQGDMVFERVETLVQPHLRRLCNELETELKRRRNQPHT